MAETLLAGDAPDGRDPAVRRLLADGLFRHIEILRARPDLIRRAGAGPSWCQYQGGPWPTPQHLRLGAGRRHRGRRRRLHALSARERRAAAAAAAWILAFNARWQVALIDHGLSDAATIALVQDRQQDY
jgi:hypothetical protein